MPMNVTRQPMVEAKIAYEGNLRCRALHGPSESLLETDAPIDNMGKGERFSPTDLVGAALATCVLTTIAIVAQRRGFETALLGMQASVRKFMTTEPPRRIARLELDLHLPLRADHPERARIEAAVSGCPVRHSLHPEVVVVDTLTWAD
jgi:putative redox protein